MHCSFLEGMKSYCIKDGLVVSTALVVGKTLAAIFGLEFLSSRVWSLLYYWQAYQESILKQPSGDVEQLQITILAERHIAQPIKIHFVEQIHGPQWSWSKAISTNTFHNYDV